MKIGILTHPLLSNYGGILQAFALQTFLQLQGHDVVIIDRRDNCQPWKGFVKKILAGLGGTAYSRTGRRFAAKVEPISHFVRSNFRRTAMVMSENSMRKTCNREHFDAIIVGSDQVWRYDFAKEYKLNYFLDFIPEKSDVLRIAYAASFGLDTWEYDDRQTQRITELLNRFRSVSVREDQGGELCRKYLRTTAITTVDPTLLLNGESYNQITAPRLIEEEYVFVYWLGTTEAKKNALTAAQLKPGMRIIEVDLRADEKLIPVEEWLSYIRHASRIVTDSFHGCVFSLIFKRQFNIVQNSSGGYGRICSLLKMAGLENKIQAPFAEVDYSVVDQALTIRKQQSVDFLLNSLS